VSINLDTVSKNFTTPCYAYDFDAIKNRLISLRKKLNKNIDLLYAMKSNPNPFLLKAISKYVDGVDISSLGEMELASKQGLDPMNFSFAGPGKTENDLIGALRGKCGILSVESIDELNRLAKLENKIDFANTKVMLRINPPRVSKEFSLKMGGRSTQFGIDESEFHQCLEKINLCKKFKLIGIHVYSGTQCLSLSGLEQNFQFTLELAERLMSQYDIKLERINLGGGVGIPIYVGEESLSEDDIANIINKQTEQFSKNHKETLFSIELGRYLVGEFGYYLSKVVSIKKSHGESIIVLDGGMHHHLAASGNLGQGLRKNYLIKNISSIGLGQSGPAHDFKITGCLCTPIDLLGVKVKMQNVKVDDVLVFFNSGAYGFTASPLMFLGHKTPQEIMCEDSSFKIIRPSKNLWELF
jgi:diaminopimelate decarboxylase